MTQNNIHADFTISHPSIDTNMTINNNRPKIPIEFGINVLPTDYINSIITDGGNIEAERNGKEVTLTNFTYIHNQGIAAKEWVINHNLKKYPSAFAVDSTGTVQIPDEIIYNDENTVTLIFLAAFAGKGYLN